MPRVDRGIRSEKEYAMIGITTILDNFEAIENLVIRITVLVSLVCFCSFYIWSHLIRFFRKDGKRKSRFRNTKSDLD